MLDEWWVKVWDMLEMGESRKAQGPDQLDQHSVTVVQFEICKLVPPFGMVISVGRGCEIFTTNWSFSPHGGDLVLSGRPRLQAGVQIVEF